MWINYHCLTTSHVVYWISYKKVFTIVRLQGERNPFLYSYIVFFITDLCCLCVGVFRTLPLDQYIYAGYRSTSIEIT